MAISPNTSFPTKTTAPSAAYPEGGAQNVTSPGDGTGTPWEERIVNDFFGLEQALLAASGITASGSADTALVSEYLQAIVEQAQGRASYMIEGGTSAADVYVLEANTANQSPRSYFNGMRIKFKAAAANTGASTVNVAGLGVVSIVSKLGTALSAGEIGASGFNDIVYSATGGHFVIDNPSGVIQTVQVLDGEVASGTTIIPADDTIPQQTEGDQFISATITPTKATNTLRVEAILNLSNGGSTTTGIIAALFQDATAGALCVTQMAKATVAGAGGEAVIRYDMPAGTTSATTFKVRAGAPAASTTTFNGTLSGRQFGGVLYSSLTVTEIAP